jgi:hypothetical protein
MSDGDPRGAAPQNPVTAESLLTAVTEALEKLPLPDQLKSEQDDLSQLLLPALKKAAGQAIEVFPAVRGLPGRSRSLRLYGTDFWPDFAFHRGADDEPLLAVETKLVKQDESAACAISQALGQALIYRLVYPVVLAFVVHRGRDRGLAFHHRDREAALTTRLASQDISLYVVRVFRTIRARE